MSKNIMELIAYASGLAGVDPKSGLGPAHLAASSHLLPLVQGGLVKWKKAKNLARGHASQAALEEEIAAQCTALAEEVATALRHKERICVVGGDHASAIGTWSGVHAVYAAQGDIGLIWIDAHMDSHTPETTESGRIHGMPLAVLLGHGYSALTSVMQNMPKLKPENVCLIGVRSFEKGEAKFLQDQNVRIYFMDEVRERGYIKVLQEAIQHVSKNTVGYGVSLDLDSIDPQDAPGVDVPEANGISGADMYAGLKIIAQDPKLIMTEIVEFDPSRDQDQKTEKLIVKFLEVLAKGKEKHD